MVKNLKDIFDEDIQKYFEINDIKTTKNKDVYDKLILKNKYKNLDDKELKSLKQKIKNYIKKKTYRSFKVLCDNEDKLYCGRFVAKNPAGAGSKVVTASNKKDGNKNYITNDIIILKETTRSKLNTSKVNKNKLYVYKVYYEKLPKKTIKEYERRHALSIDDDGYMPFVPRHKTKLISLKDEKKRLNDDRKQDVKDKIKIIKDKEKKLKKEKKAKKKAKQKLKKKAKTKIK